MITVVGEKGKKMPRLIDKDELKKAIQENICQVMCDEPRGCSCCRVDDVWNVIYEMPTVDAVEVVRCKDCAYWGNKVMLKDGTRGDCLNFFGYMTTTDFFCKWGEKRNQGGQNA